MMSLLGIRFFNNVFPAFSKLGEAGVQGAFDPDSLALRDTADRAPWCRRWVVVHENVTQMNNLFILFRNGKSEKLNTEKFKSNGF
ncbi:MAG: hypothetical protein CBC46_09355 [Verrucomicrobiaceae bacterium TMED86]|nr:MAG: hypothetical protein CBC46_09355 [Verrucomicrobiaceae bacterium TMED86]